MRTCRRCGTPRPVEMFYTAMEARKSAKLGRPWQTHCRVCNREANAQYRKPRQDYVDSVKLAAGCVDCGIRSPHPEIYDFDHRPDEQKTKPVAAYLTSGTIDDLRAEIVKCDVVCANCHRIRTRQREHGAFGKDRR